MGVGSEGYRMGPWLPVLQALAAYSPFDRGRDSGYASRRAVEHARWPAVGPAPVLDEAGYEHCAEELVRSGTVLDRRMIYWYARPSEHVPTPEIRVADVNARIGTVVLLARQRAAHRRQGRLSRVRVVDGLVEAVAAG
ncbi:glutamate-cysteine ligase family protein [Streptomyces sp. NPDC006487]|uniref:glutamate-cysteine ligase family protein n=1 Tax=Streptomyces sp. NPDC006487 TaxID=3364748 RepID=UPI0036BF3400